MPAGRPSDYSDTTANTICYRLSNGESLNAICKDDSMPARATVFKWLHCGKYPQFVDQYRRAREDQAEAMADDLTWIADNADDPRKAKVQVDTRMWIASKLLPKKYGDTKQVSISGELVMAHLSDSQLTQRIEHLQQQLSLLNDTIPDAEFTDNAPDNGLATSTDGADA